MSSVNACALHAAYIHTVHDYYIIIIIHTALVMLRWQWYQSMRQRLSLVRSLGV